LVTDAASAGDFERFSEEVLDSGPTNM
jgi:hypothetical protein